MLWVLWHICFGTSTIFYITNTILLLYLSFIFFSKNNPSLFKITLWTRFASLPLSFRMVRKKTFHLSSLSLTQRPLTRTSFSLSIPSNPSLSVVPPTLTCFRANHCYNFILSFPLFVELLLNFFIPVSFSLPPGKHKHKSNGYTYTLSNEKVFVKDCFFRPTWHYFIGNPCHINILLIFLGKSI